MAAGSPSIRLSDAQIAILNDDLPALRTLIANHADLEAPGENIGHHPSLFLDRLSKYRAYTPLAIAAYIGSVSSVQALLSAHVNVNAVCYSLDPSVKTHAYPLGSKCSVFAMAVAGVLDDPTVVLISRTINRLPYEAERENERNIRNAHRQKWHNNFEVMLLLLQAGATIHFSPEHPFSSNLTALFFVIRDVLLDCLSSAADKLDFTEKYGIDREDFFILLKALVPMIMAQCEQLRDKSYESVIIAAFSSFMEIDPIRVPSPIASYRDQARTLPLIKKIKLEHYCTEIQTLVDQAFAEITRRQSTAASGSFSTARITAGAGAGAAVSSAELPAP